jgi:cysteine synthase A
MTIRAGFAGTIGRTPLIRLGKFSDETGCEILGKAEFMNPGGSVKDRAARAILEAAERDGRLRPGGTLVEGTAGNTGIGFVHLCNERGYRCVIVMPDNQSPEKAALLRTLGADVRIVKTVRIAIQTTIRRPPRAWPTSCPMRSGATSSTTPPTATRTTRRPGPEIWQQTSGGISAFVCATGTGGTLGGVSRYLKSCRDGVRCVLADPLGSALYHWVKTGQLKSDGSSAVTEGIGIGRVTANLEGAPLDDAVRIEDPEIVRTVYRLLHEEGLFLGGTSGVNVAAAVRVARELGPGHTV